ncbi:NAD-glutamate dehydrogenase [Lapillicoccus jejuensis]|uniref:Glutamate dehydrogenase (NAD) n=1 Tax=Lapillicoccus jejuensis TaxID=402171 RepID=A0A542E2P0_9MICO|nr:NAD-glutamate dehydrogenase [Lapillicoccus jejuensis]TQJ09586.1 glutamate dehydrogenase (NAD) [Lapillicoccus jejuensis]
MPTSLELSRAQQLHAAADLAGPAARARGGEELEAFVRRYYRHVATEDLLARQPGDLLGAALAHRELAQHRPPGTVDVQVANPHVEADGWSCGHTVVLVVTDDMPFLVDSVTAELARRDRTIHLLVHPQLVVHRDPEGRLLDVVDADPSPVPDGDTLTESWMLLEVDRIGSEEEREDLRRALTAVLDDVRDAVEDWPRMWARCEEVARDLRTAPPVGVDAGEAATSARFLDWLADHHFTFLGYREYRLTGSAGDPAGEALEAVSGSGLGILRDDHPGRRTPLSGAARAIAHEPHVLVLTKANSRATVHRDVHLDYVGVRTFDEQGRVTGERRFLGLLASSAYTESILGIPILDERVQEVLHRAGFSPDSHSGKDLLQVMESYPRDELLQTNADELLETCLEVLRLAERRRTRLFLRPDVYGRFMSCLVYLPRDRYNTAVRLKMETILRRAFRAESVDFSTRVGESALARLHFVVRVPRGATLPQVDAADLEREVVEATRTWEEDLAEATRTELGEEAGARLVGLYGRAFPEAFKEDFHPRVGVADLRRMEALTDDDGVELGLYHEPGAPADERRFKLYRRGPLSLTAVLPLFTHLGVEVVDERPYEVHRADGVTVHVYDFGLRAARLADVTGAERESFRQLLQDAFRAVWRGQAESDGFNALVLDAGLTWRQVVVLRAVAKYLRQTRSTFSQDYVEAALVSNADLARRLVELFETRFDPSRYDAAAGEERAAAEQAQAAELLERLDDVASLDHDRIVRALLGVVRATLRTSYYQVDEHGDPLSYVALKLDPHRVPDLPKPVPMFEIWVYAPRVEGVHLRFGKVARGGLRWSDRREDFRTEILGLVKAQMVKNAVIVPTGSKGGFYPKQLPDPAADRDAWLAEGVASYRTFISGLLSVTDNLVSGEVVPPERVVRHDGDDTYLVVAADKGTATFSDIANGLAQEHGFWLDDAFASGGSAGYDHKAMGITARGAWESVKRHFRELGLDTQTEDFTVVGVGDMSGDVFGNGMLLSEHIRLVAAFDHRHVMVDPDPDAATSYAERARLFGLPRSSWADYDTALLSEGGGVWPRTAKSVPVSPQARRALGLPDGTTSLTPAELIHAILLAPVDLLWNGGIGTYVKAATESQSDAGDRANDGIRVDGHELRVRVVGEGGNLGLTQLGRIEAAEAGVRVNTDAIDNSAGVDTSDHEVNLKILLTDLVREGDLTLKQRNALLHEMTDEVAAQVLRDNYEQNVLLGNARAQEHAMLPVHQRLIHWLEQRGDLDRTIEFLPSDAEIAKRRDAGLGLTSPEFSVLVAYAKLALKHDLLPTALPDDPWFRTTLEDYFPAPVRERLGDHIGEHPLRREIITNTVVNSMVNRGGITFAFRVAEETGAEPEHIARAFVVCREVFDLAGWVAQVEALDNQVPTAVQTQLYLEFRRLLDRAVRWFVTARPGTIDVGAEVARFRDVVAAFAPRVGELLQGAEHERLEAKVAELEGAGAPPAVARRAAGLLDQFSLLDVVEIAQDLHADPQDVVGVYYQCSERFGIDAMLTRVSRLPRDDRWDALARGAMRDDLYAVLDSLTRAVLATADAAGSPAERFEQWAGANKDALTRARNALDGIERLDTAGIAALSVALRTLRSVLRSAGQSG